MKQILILSALSLLMLAACNKPVFYSQEGRAHGTTYTIIYEGEADDLSLTEIDSVVRAFDASLSTYNPNSLISLINRSDTGMYTDSLFDLMYHKAREVYEKTNGAFDITVAPLSNLYGFGFTEKADTINRDIIDSILQYTGMDKVQLSNGFLHKAHPLTSLDGNAIAKGLSVDNITRHLRTKGIENFLIEVGGEVYAQGMKRDRQWIVGIDKPIDGNMQPGKHLQAKIALTDKALATSGDYRRFYMEDGKKYAHTINPKTGEPALSDLLSVTIVANDCMTADAYATACMAMGLEKSMKLINSLPNIEAYFISSDETGNYLIEMTEGMHKMIIE